MIKGQIEMGGGKKTRQIQIQHINQFIEDFVCFQTTFRQLQEQYAFIKQHSNHKTQLQLLNLASRHVIVQCFG